MRRGDNGKGSGTKGEGSGLEKDSSLGLERLNMQMGPLADCGLHLEPKLMMSFQAIPFNDITSDGS